MSDIFSKIGVISTLINVHHVLGLKLQNTVLTNAPELFGLGIFLHPFFPAFWVPIMVYFDLFLL